MKFVKPLGFDAPVDRFSEARAIQHIKVLSQDIPGRQEGQPGLRQAADYIKSQLHLLQDRAGPDIRIEIEETMINGSFNMMFLGRSISLAYRNHTNILMRISSAVSEEDDPAVLLNGHFDSPPGSPGAADCGSCVASLLEVARLVVDSGWVPMKPIIFLFNGAEELFMVGSHGFMKTHRWTKTIGAFINLEASGNGGPDFVCQSGPGSWPSLVYAQSALFPMGSSANQDVFGIVPGDTDYRIFANDHGNIPGLDIIYLIGGYYYHTSTDTVERLLPGSIQARGENVIRVVKAFTMSTKIRNAYERESLPVNDGLDNERPIFFDYMSWFLIYYTRRQAMVLHSIPVVVFILVPFLLRLSHLGFWCSIATFCDFIIGLLFHVTGILLAILVPIIFSIVRLLFSSHSMNWFGNPYLAYMMFIPPSVVGLLIPRFVWRSFPLYQDPSRVKSSVEELAGEARFWGAFGQYALMTLGYLVAGLGGGFLYFFFSAFMLLAWFCFSLSIKSFGRHSLRSAACYIIPLLPCILYVVYFGGVLIQFLIEKMGMMGSLPPPYGYFVPDVIVAAIIGAVTSLSLGPLVPLIGNCKDAPKRVIFQHTIQTDVGRIVDSAFDISVLDSNSLIFLFKHAPEIASELEIGPDFSLETADLSRRERWMAIYPLSSLFSRSIKVPAKSDAILSKYRYLPHLSSYKPPMISDVGSRRVYLEFSLGSLEEVWVAVLNITGPLSSWSFAENVLPAPEVIGGGPPSYICRLSGAGQKNWTFWLEANSSAHLVIEVGVVDQYLVDQAAKIKGLFPDWVDVIAFSSYLSNYVF
ncbi:Endoplasmic reticulum metallopeptidase 1 [Heracleum sosnowskyi]|uniref:Endoplasmic reticulum metallopeptidase 1 n=1 Tax=Heracleum sosnowskyi TaxID=360622 RepID=A0AAD8JIM0_9APIA|nr:Endoplasmic reticulum metallopeptidase 1 [Heracleum sosnowskyi]